MHRGASLHTSATTDARSDCGPRRTDEPPRRQSRVADIASVTLANRILWKGQPRGPRAPWRMTGRRGRNQRPCQRIKCVAGVRPRNERNDDTSMSPRAFRPALHTKHNARATCTAPVSHGQTLDTTLLARMARHVRHRPTTSGSHPGDSVAGMAAIACRGVATTRSRKGKGRRLTAETSYG